ncbi:MTH938/NDUFAF3 family protein [candidate division KSB1 bacterium]|nr:MTH938/NDUFAF3 family protein [candidate division KSB1 bacterium]
MAVTVEKTSFGSITIDGKTYEHDVLIRLSEEIKKRKKKLSKRLYGTSHVLSLDEAKHIYEKGCKVIIIGSGQHDSLRLSPEAEAYFKKKDCKVILQGTPTAIRTFNQTKGSKIGVFHVTC